MLEGDKNQLRTRRRQEQRARQRRGSRNVIFELLELIQAFWAQRPPILRLLIVYCLSLFGFLFLYSKIAWSPLLKGFLSYNAQATGFIVGIFRPGVETQNNLVQSGEFAIRIVGDCTILAPLAIFISGVLAFPATLGQKVAGIALGFVVLSVVNLLRTTSLFYIGLTSPWALETAHLLVWQSIVVILAVVLWIFWWRRLVYSGRVQS